MKWYGLTGGIATGKSTVTRMLRQRGVPVIDADQIVEELMAPQRAGWTKVRQEFGPGFFDASGQYDRKKMAALIFDNPRERARLEGVLHPLVQAEVLSQRQLLASQGKDFALYDVPLLFEKNLSGLFDGVIVVAADEPTQRQRMVQHRGYSPEQVERRMKAQVPIQEKIKQADFVVDNSGDISHLEREVERLLVWLGRQGQSSDQSSKA